MYFFRTRRNKCLGNRVNITENRTYITLHKIVIIFVFSKIKFVKLKRKTENTEKVLQKINKNLYSPYTQSEISWEFQNSAITKNNTNIEFFFFLLM